MIDLETIHFFSSVVLAGFLGAILGAERRLRGKDVGVRTASVIAAGSCLFTILSIHGFGTSENVDVTRIASQVVTGVGFLGAGTVLKTDNKVHGLTTAANIWLTAAIGMTVGVGNYLLAMMVTLFSLVALIVLSPISRWLRNSGMSFSLAQCFTDEDEA